MEKAELIELLADKEHTSWAHWMAYLFSTCEMQADGSMCIPPDLVERWRRQVATPYNELAEREQQSDRNRVAHILPIIEEYKDTSPVNG